MPTEPLTKKVLIRKLREAHEERVAALLEVKELTAANAELQVERDTADGLLDTAIRRLEKRQKEGRS